MTLLQPRYVLGAPFLLFGLEALGISAPWPLALAGWLAYLLLMFLGYEYRQDVGDAFFNRYCLPTAALFLLWNLRTNAWNWANPTGHANVPVWIQWPLIAMVLAMPWLFSRQPFEQTFKRSQPA